jgi:hypothetical protein
MEREEGKGRIMAIGRQLACREMEEERMEERR